MRRCFLWSCWLNHILRRAAMACENSKEEKAYIYMVKAYIYIDWQLLKQCCYKSKSPPFPRNDVLLHFAACWIKMCLFKGWCWILWIKPTKKSLKKQRKTSFYN
jgi:hypothetical protein